MMGKVGGFRSVPNDVSSFIWYMYVYYFVTILFYLSRKLVILM